MIIPSTFPKAQRQSGVSLVEIMVALVIGLVVTLIINQVLSTYEGQKRTTSGTSDAQTTGALALDAIQRETLMAGYGLNLLRTNDSDNPFGCTNFVPTAFRPFPLRIIDGGTAAGASDRVFIAYADTMTGGIPVNRNTFGAMIGCTNGERALVVDGATCTLTTIARVAGAAPAPDNVNATANPSGRPFTCLGQWRQVEFRVNGTNLERIESLNAGAAQPAAPIGSDIVALKAQYGISSASNDNRIVQWVPATGTWADASLTPANRARIKAIRIAVVARNNLLERANVTTACSSTTAANPTGLCTWDATSANPDTASPAPALNLTHIPDWQRYRYRVFETIIPMRNVIWAKGSLQL